MAFPPATPSKSGYVTQHNPTMSSKSTKSCSILDPSPASTYGETVSANSVPATPHDVTGQHVKDFRVQFPQARSPTLQEKFGAIGLEMKMHTPTKRSGSNFIVKSHTSANEDPFTTIATPTKRRDDAAVTSSNAGTPSSRIDMVNSTSAGTKVAYSASPPKVQQPMPQPTSENAQAIYPPEACVFVANLANNATDAQLLASVQAIFNQYGICFPKIRRDNRGMPYAFVQFTDARCAMNAVTHGKNQVIEGRKCRTEMAKARRAIWVTKINGGQINAKVVEQILSSYGVIEHVFWPTKVESHMYGLPQGGGFFQFKYFQACQDATADLRSHTIYRFEVTDALNRAAHIRPHPAGPIPLPKDLPKPKALPLPLGGHGSTSFGKRNPDGSVFTEGTAIDVENLPPGVTYYDLITVFGDHGRILVLKLTFPQPLYTLNSNDPNEILSTVSAYIEFEDASSVASAVRNEDMRVVKGGHKIRVKPYTGPRKPRAATSASHFPSHMNVNPVAGTIGPFAASWPIQEGDPPGPVNPYAPGMTYPRMITVPYIQASGAASPINMQPAANFAQFAPHYYGYPGHGSSSSFGSNQHHYGLPDFTGSSGEGQ